MNLFSDDVRRDPYPVYDQLRGRSPVFFDPQSGLWMVFDYEGVRRVLSDHDTFSSKNGPDWLIFVDPPRHTKLRALVSQAFTPRSVANLEPRIRELSRRLLDGVIERGEMDLAADFSVPLPMMVIAQMLGAPVGDLPRFVRWSDAILNMSYTVPGSAGEAARAATDEFLATTIEANAYLTGLLAERRAAPRDDLLGRLVRAEVDGERLTQEEILGFFQLLLVGGQETTTNLINNAVLCLLEHPDQFARLRAAPELLPSAVEEVLRYRSPLQWMFRFTRQEVRVHDQVIPARRLVLAMIGSANRDPRVFPDAGTFDVTRAPNPHMAFGHGIHFCLGAPLARLEARVALADLLGRARGLALAGGGPWQPRKALHVHGPARLPVRFDPGPRAGAPA
jgi:cytochrome P450